MKRVLVLAAVAAFCLTGGVAEAADGVPGVDVSNWTGEVDWAAVTAGGGKFAFVHATEGADYRSPSFDAQFGGAADAGLIRGAYHFAQPHESDGATQAEFFVQNGGRWTGDGVTLPGVLDLEDNPYKDKNGKNTCYDLSPADMVTWIKGFAGRYKARTGRNVIIYTTTSWWRTCTGDSAKFGAYPLWLARWGADPGELPKSWQRHTFWQSAEKGTLAGGQNAFNGSEAQLKELATAAAEVTISGQARSRRSYTLTVANTGPYPVTSIKVTGRTYGKQRVIKATGCTFSGTAIKCTVPKLNRGQKVRMTFTTNAPAKGTVGIRFTVGSVKVDLKAR
ncbi:GH25 family lysozyme [Nonomuraea sp. NBC_01738]|uniref:GH25 family lysozyme n=1 Tax=Nonomuraea sp. NBC_01738 TaxID=2976003 RepID=UPI002E0D464B|nr:GH25 family lysozyme [Nonomuraea sp. NBC_01738]